MAGAASALSRLDIHGALTPLLPHVRAVLVALAALALVIAGMPGFDFIPSTAFSPRGRAEIERVVPDWLVPVVDAGLWFESTVRRPLDERLGPIERTFRISQSWHLYRNGPSRVARLEVLADGELLHRSLDPDHAWLESVLRNRRVRPVAEAVTTDDGGKNWKGLTRYLTEVILEERPDTKEVVVRATWSPWPGDRPVVHHGYVAKAPDWTVRKQ